MAIVSLLFSVALLCVTSRQVSTTDATGASKRVHTSKSASQSGERKADHKKIDAILVQLDAATQAFYPVAEGGLGQGEL